MLLAKKLVQGPRWGSQSPGPTSVSGVVVVEVLLLGPLLISDNFTLPLITDVMIAPWPILLSIYSFFLNEEYNRKNAHPKLFFLFFSFCYTIQSSLYCAGYDFHKDFKDN